MISSWPHWCSQTKLLVAQACASGHQLEPERGTLRLGVWSKLQSSYRFPVDSALHLVNTHSDLRVCKWYGNRSMTKWPGIYEF
jgi:hypothetical protein